VETHHQQTAATTMGVAEEETPSSLTSSHPNTNNPNQEGKSACFYASIFGAQAKFSVQIIVVLQFLEALFPEARIFGRD